MFARRLPSVFQVKPVNHLDFPSHTGDFSGLVFALHVKHLGISNLLMIQNDSQFAVSKESFPLQTMFQSCKPISSMYNINNLAVKLVF